MNYETFDHDVMHRNFSLKYLWTHCLLSQLWLGCKEQIV